MPTLAEIRSQLGEPTKAPIESIPVPVGNRICDGCDGKTRKFYIQTLLGVSDSERWSYPWIDWEGECLTCGATDIYAASMSRVDGGVLMKIASALFPGDPWGVCENCHEAPVITSTEYLCVECSELQLKHREIVG